MRHIQTNTLRRIVIVLLSGFAISASDAQSIGLDDGRGADAAIVSAAHTLVLPFSMRIDPQTANSDRKEGAADSDFGLVYHEISDFFNIREANANVSQGVWELEFELGWSTDSAGGDDDLAFTPNIKYGITDDMFAEVEVLPLNIGDGGDQGNGDLAVQLFNQWVHEDDVLPAFATWGEARLPTGEGSSGVDAELHFNLTKTLLPRFRGHLEGFIQTANGGRGDEDEGRRPFQWGVGPGFDYQFDARTIAAMNYLLRSSEELGEPDQNTLELGMVRELTEGQYLKFAVDVGLDGHETTPNFEAKLLWSIEWD